MTYLLEGKTALVTGGTAGIGKAIALKFAQQGAKVAIFGTHSERGAVVVEELNSIAKEHSSLFMRVDVSSQQEVETAIKTLQESFSHIDILVNNAGVTHDQLLMKMEEDEWDRVMAINAKSCYNTCHALVRSMMKARHGKIINISSVVGLIGNPGQTNYAASKAAVIGFTKALAKELASRNIHVNCIAPGFIDTPMTEKLTGAQKETILAMIPMGKMGAPEDIANAALFLASDLSAYITGQVITVDGGFVM